MKLLLNYKGNNNKRKCENKFQGQVVLRLWENLF